MPANFESNGSIRYHHRRSECTDIYFVSNREARNVEAKCTFRSDGTVPELWDPVTGRHSRLTQARELGGSGESRRVEIPLQFAAHQSWLVTFRRDTGGTPTVAQHRTDFPALRPVAELTGPWQVQFDPQWGGPAKPMAFDQLIPWNQHALEGIRYYSGEATYRLKFNAPEGGRPSARVYLDLGVVDKLARVKLNGKDMGIVWTPPYRVEITTPLQKTENQLEISVVNTWVNRLIGDQQPANKGVRQLKWDTGLLEGRSFAAGRYTFTTVDDYNASSPLQDSGLLGPVVILSD